MYYWEYLWSHDNFDLEAAHVIPALVRKFVEANENNTNVKVWGDGKATRDFIHAHDVAVGIIDALNLNEPELINLSSGEEISIKQVVDYLIDISVFKRYRVGFFTSCRTIQKIF